MRRWPEDFIDKVICGDCLEVMKEMPDGCLDLVLTDPPFNMGENYGPMTNDARPWSEYFHWLGQRLRQAQRCLSDRAWFFCRFPLREIRRWLPELPENARIWAEVCEFVQFRSTPIQWAWCPIAFWPKGLTGRGKPIAGKRDWSVAPAFTPATRHVHGHPTQQCQMTFERIIYEHTEIGNIVLDPFLGSGTTALAAKKLGRHFVGIEINPDYCRIAERRLQNLQPELLFAEKA